MSTVGLFDPSIRLFEYLYAQRYFYLQFVREIIFCEMQSHAHYLKSFIMNAFVLLASYS